MLSRRFLVTWLLVISCLPCSAEPAASPSLSPLVERTIAAVFERGLVSTFFDDDVRHVAEHYVRNSRWGGRVRVNEMPAADALNIYIFTHGPGVPQFLKDNCAAFPRDAVIFCDHRFLDSIPGSFPVQFKGTDGIPPPGLLFWVLGHEIGHVVLQHHRSSFLQFAGESADAVEAQGATGADRLREINANEIDADRFAVMALPSPP